MGRKTDGTIRAKLSTFNTASDHYQGHARCVLLAAMRHCVEWASSDEPMTPPDFHSYMRKLQAAIQYDTPAPAHRAGESEGGG